MNPTSPTVTLAKFCNNFHELTNHFNQQHASHLKPIASKTVGYDHQV